ncbi:MAG: T9SS type A sorting domain-containing protein, partial [Flavobacteriales bacterium]|nr:T9SS type A sorting domain-containing protein [Flavobacteriales bacterium]
DNGALKAYLPDNSIYPNFILNNPDPFPIQDGAWYRVRCSVQSNTNGQVTVGVKGLSTEGNPYTTWQQEIPFGTERRDLEMYFQSDLTDQARIRFQNQWTDPMYYLDNVEVTRVNVQPLDPHEKNKLLINDQLQAANFDLPAGCWSDVLGNPLTSPVSIPAFGSIVIYRLPDEDCDNISTGLETPGGPETPPALYPNPAERGGELRFAPRGQARLTLVDMRGTTALQMDLANGASSILLPSSIAPGPYVVRIQSDHGRDVQRLIIR